MTRCLLALATLLAASLLVAQESDPLEGQAILPNYYRLRPDIATARDNPPTRRSKPSRRLDSRPC